jgi:lipopolysaccharide transport system ATP-binding protein
MPDDTFAIRAEGLSKCYALYDHPADRLKQMLARGRKRYYREFWALREVGFELPKGQVLGLVGRNGAGKSTLLQLVCGTLAPSAGRLEVNGRIAALLELGAGFNPEFSGRENVYLSATILGLSKAEVDRRFDAIVEFSGIPEFIDQPVKTYSSGMYVRLAFSVATSVDPDILVIDEALSVGDGEFARKSFDRIRALKEAGKTILFCSHSLYQVEAFCDQVLWLEQGRAVMLGEPQEVVRRYGASLAGAELEPESPSGPAAGPPPPAEEKSLAPGHARLSRVEVSLDGRAGRDFKARPGESDLSVRVQFESDPALPPPHVGVTLDYGTLLAVSCAVSRSDGVAIERDAQGRGEVVLDFPKLPLRKGEYLLAVYLGCENALHIYDSVQAVARLTVEDALPEPGLVDLPRRWRARAGHPA